MLGPQGPDCAHRGCFGLRIDKIRIGRDRCIQLVGLLTQRKVPLQLRRCFVTCIEQGIAQHTFRFIGLIGRPPLAVVLHIGMGFS